MQWPVRLGLALDQTTRPVFIVRILLNYLSLSNGSFDFGSGNSPDSGTFNCMLGIQVFSRKKHLLNVCYFVHCRFPCVCQSSGDNSPARRSTKVRSLHNEYHRPIVNDTGAEIGNAFSQPHAVILSQVRKASKQTDKMALNIAIRSSGLVGASCCSSSGLSAEIERAGPFLADRRR